MSERDGRCERRIRAMSCCTKDDHDLVSAMISQDFAKLFKIEDHIMLLSNLEQEDRERIVRYRSDEQQYEHDFENTN